MRPVPLTEHGADAGAPVTARRAVPRVAQPRHQYRPGPGDPFHAPAGHVRLAAEPVAGQARAHHVERVRRVASVCRGIGQRPDDLPELDHGAGPAMGQDQRQRVRPRRADVREHDAYPVDLRLEAAARSAAPRPPASRSRPPSTRTGPAGRPSGTPCDQSDTGSASGQRVCRSRCLRSASWVSGTSRRNGRISWSHDRPYAWVACGHDDHPGHQGLDLGAAAPLPRVRLRHPGLCRHRRPRHDHGQRRGLAARAGRRRADPPGTGQVVAAGVRLPRPRRAPALRPAARADAQPGRPAVPELGPGRDRRRRPLRRAGPGRGRRGAAPGGPRHRRAGSRA